MFRRWLDGLAPAAQSRVLLCAALLPAFVAVTVTVAALAPSFGWIVDHCALSLDSHTHPHICAAHHVATLPALTLLALSGVFAARVIFAFARTARAIVSAVLTRRALAQVASESTSLGAQVLPFEEPQAFVVGLFRPSVFVTRGLLADTHREHLEAVLAHEAAHIRRRDSLRRLAAFIALPFHLPGIAAWIERRLARAHEMAADAEAAALIRSPERVAHALVRLARANRPAPTFALAFGGSNLEVRVATLLDSRPRMDQPKTAALAVAGVMGLVLVGFSADAIHHGVEMLLGILGG